MVAEKDFPNLAIENLLKVAGAERVSDSAVDEMKKILKEYLYNLSIKAAKISSHAGRKTINEGDILIANE